ncbi:hypothetical protein D3P07_21165 [Paenibacillus sp. 1011MAR3C5]|uniref:hypothetical protein n=1 Tax=Paenibacillus sp. 1011MAR3C5 TaxID=1675787 RepID=UPI000E6C0C77|nr:hypothetical protein [Paenibacillus sp. 1011MAR3C5]RJE85085.1 hypothetical protein D3P07_21165 [Paenibacillus sp. 1011MAR3C5]
MKRWVLLLLLIIFVCIPIVYEHDHAELIQEMAAKEFGYYHVYVFWDNEGAEGSSLPASMLRPFDSEDFRQSLHIARLQVVQLNPQDPNYRYVKVFEMKRTPTYVLLDHQKVLLETSEIEDILHYLYGDATWLRLKREAKPGY